MSQTRLPCLSVLWLFILLNIIFRDIHQLVLASHLQMLLTGHYNGMEITEELMLLGGVLVQVPIAMVLFSLLLTRRIGLGRMARSPDSLAIRLPRTGQMAFDTACPPG